MYLYRIGIDGSYGKMFSYAKKENIKALAEHLNIRIKNFPKERVLNVTLVKNYDDTNGVEIFSKLEYNIQWFYETYEYRLLQEYKLHHAV